MPKAFLLTHKRYDLYHLNTIPRRLWKQEQEKYKDLNKKSNGRGYFENVKLQIVSSSTTAANPKNICGKVKWISINQRRDEDTEKFDIDSKTHLEIGKESTVLLQIVEQKNLNIVKVKDEVTTTTNIVETNRGIEWNSPAGIHKQKHKDVDTYKNIIDQKEKEEEPVNLSIKKIDLFNLTQLAEVSSARAGYLYKSAPIIIDPDSEGHVSSTTNSSSGHLCHSDQTAIKGKETKLILSNDKNIEEDGNLLPSSTSSSSSSSSSSSHSLYLKQQIICEECGKGFSTLSNLSRHRQTHRSPTDSSAIKKCPHCNKIYVSIPAYSMHLRTHNQGCKCPYCEKGFSRPWLLQGHIRTHTGEKPFHCNICGKSFADKSNLRAHTQTHSNEKPFNCIRCSKTFALKSYLCKHIESSCMKIKRSYKLNVNIS